MDNLEKLLYLSGVSADYYDYSGQRRQVSFAHRLAALRAIGINPADVEAVEQAIFELDAEPWQQWLRPIYVVEQSVPSLAFSCHPAKLHELLTWKLQLESGVISYGEFLPCALLESGNYVIGDCRYSARVFVFDENIPSGYHQFTLSNHSGSEQTTLAVCPSNCYGAALKQADAAKAWGFSCQLYTLRREGNWGMGDFGDLRELIAQSASQGADLIGLNPLHALCSDDVEAVSPYSPSDRRFLNPLYIDVVWAQAITQSAVISALLKERAVVVELTALRDMPLIDYPRVAAIKYQAFEALFAHFSEHHLGTDSDPALLFAAFNQDQGQSLLDFCLYEAHHNPLAPTFGGDIVFYQFIQWLAREQLNACQQQTIMQGMSIGLMADLAVGAVGDGCEVRSNTEVYLASATLGAPPDPFASAGQNWGLSVVNPASMQRHKFSHFISLLQANMRSAGGLRIDHAMSLMRLWWCLAETPASAQSVDNGLYVYYPMHELMALLRLESQRNHCLVVGEDLGIVPQEFRVAMTKFGLFSNNLLYFEQHDNQGFKAVEQHQSDALLMVTNHDVATLAQWWSADDIHQCCRLGLLNETTSKAHALHLRKQQKHQLLRLLAENNLLLDGWQLNDMERKFDAALCESIHRVSARSHSRLLLIQLEDLQLMETPVNIPGTYLEYPNWRRKQLHNTRQLFLQNDTLQIVSAVNEERKH